MSRNFSATGWSAGATVLTFTGSLAGSVAGAVAVAAGGVVVAASSGLAAGAIAVSTGLVSIFGSTAFAAVPGSLVLSVALPASGTEAVASSILKSPMLGGGTLAGSGRG